MDGPGTAREKETGPVTQPRLILALETSTHSGGAALLRLDDRNPALVGSVSFTTRQLYSQRLLPSVKWLLERVEVAAEDVDVVAVAVGPGSFTGLRIGLSVAKALAYAGGAEIIGLGTLQALAVRASGGRDAVVCPMLDARQGQVYAGIYQVRWQEGFPSVEILRADWAGPAEEIAAWIDQPTIFAGDALELAQEKIQPAIGDRFLLPPVHHRLPHPEDLAMLAATKTRAGQFDNIVALEPQYVRQSYTQK